MSNNTVFKSTQEIAENITPDLKNNLREQEDISCVLYPRLACKVNYYQEQLIFSQDGREFVWQVKGFPEKILQKLFLKMDGTNNWKELQEKFFPNHPQVLISLLQNLDKQEFLDDATPLSLNSGIDTWLELEDFTHQLLEITDQSTADLSPKVLYGFAIENYHLFSHKADFDTPVLSWQSSNKVKQLLDDLYHQESGQYKLLLAALDSINLSGEELTQTMPLPETMAIYNGLAYWANFDPLFFVMIRGVFAEQILKDFELYLKNCISAGMNSSFIEQIQQLINLKKESQEKNIFHSVWQEIPHLEPTTQERFKSQIYLFVEMYSNFLNSIKGYYSSTDNLGRLVSAI
ncbi:MAG: hypothetical protein WA919_23595 [Coleofasciculaceae cyanobacterium]